jgi:ABC-2 type transport system ATP-binding protein
MITLGNLGKQFGTFWAVRDLTLTVPPGELFCFLGPNGAGKTTTIKMACGLLRPTTGTVCVAGGDPVTDQAVRAAIGYIPDQPFLYERLTAAEFFKFVGDIYRIPPERIRQEREELFDLFGLQSQASSLIGDLSHGFRQRLIYAATLLHKPRVLFVDEPFIGLDPHTIRLLRELLRAKARAGMTIFLTTHILALVEGLADRVGILAGGRLAALGTVEELCARAGGAAALEDVFLGLTQSDSLNIASPSVLSGAREPI